MKKLALIAVFLHLSFCGYSQSIDEITKMKSSEVKHILDSLPYICALPADGWINSPFGNPLSPQNNGLKVIHIGSFEDYKSRRNIETLNTLQRQLPQMTFLLIGNSIFNYFSSQEDYIPLLRQYNISLPFLPDSIYKQNPCISASKGGPLTLILTPENKIIESYSGVVDIDMLASDLIRLRDVLLVFGKMNPRPFLGKSSRQFSKTPIIECPTGIAADRVNERIFVSDYSANRVLILSLQGELLDMIGTGKAGNVNGSINDAQLNGPRGLAYDDRNQMLYIADSRNNCLKRVDWKTKEIESIPTSEYFDQPENLALSSGELFITATSAIWKMNTESGVFEVVFNELTNTSGNKFKQPAGISAMYNGIVVFTDNLSSAVSYIEKGELNTPISSEGFGFSDGKKEEVKFYYPNGITPYDGGFLIADTYNNSIRWYDPFKRKSKTIAGNGEKEVGESKAIKASFNLPKDIAILNGLAYITDSGSGLIKVLDLNNGRVTNMPISNYSKLSMGYTPTIKDLRDGDTLLVSDGENNISIKINLPENYELDPEGFSQANTITRSKQIKIKDNKMDDQTIEFIFESDQSSERFLVEYILFIRSKKRPELQYKRTVSYIFPIVYSTGIESRDQKFEFTFGPDSEE